MGAFVLGFGCGSVLGRVGRGASIRAMNVAWEQGITLFDTARSYGFGEAEAVLGDFLQGRRAQAVVATKYGLPVRRKSPLVRALTPLSRVALKVPGVRTLRRRQGSVAATRGEFSVAGLRASLEASLRQLRTDYVDVLFLHEADAGAMRQQDLMAELDALIAAGKVRRAGLYAGSDVIAACLAVGPGTLTAMQYNADPFDSLAWRLGGDRQRQMLMVGNHPFGGEARVARLQALLTAMSKDETTPPELREKLRDTSGQMLLEALFGLILTETPTQALVFSMMREDHLRANRRAIENSRFSAADMASMRQRLSRVRGADGRAEQA